MPAVSHTFHPRHRLRHDREFQAVFGARVKKSAGPLTVFTRPNDLPHPRLGLSIGRRVGPAVRRNLLKRHLREAFRLLQHEIPRAAADPPASYDIVIASVAHTPLPLEEYTTLLANLVDQAHRVWQKRSKRQQEPRDA